MPISESDRMERCRFSLVECIDDVEPLFLSDSAKVETVEGVGNHLILGSRNGTVVSVALLDESQSSERIFVQNSVTLPQGRPVVQLKALPMFNRLLALSDGSLYVMALDSLKIFGPPRMQSVSCMGLNEDRNENGTPTISMAVGLRRRQIAICELQADRVNVGLELDTDDIPVALAFEDNCICYGTCSHYYIIDLKKRITRPLFPVTNDGVPPIVKRISKNEFLLTGLHNLGMFVSADGASNRPPISWDDETPVDMALRFPYAIVLSPSYVSTFSMIDQELQQRLPVSDGHRLCVCDDELFVASRRSIYQLKPVEIEKRVDDEPTSDVASDVSESAPAKPKREIKEEYLPRLPKLLQAKPTEWNEAIAPLLRNHYAMHGSAIGSGLAQARLRDASVQEKQLGAVRFQVLENSRCGACDQLFLEPNCIRYPNGSLIHPYCLRHGHLCPATQQVFCSPNTQ